MTHALWCNSRENLAPHKLCRGAASADHNITARNVIGSDDSSVAANHGHNLSPTSFCLSHRTTVCLVVRLHACQCLVVRLSVLMSSCFFIPSPSPRQIETKRLALHATDLTAASSSFLSVDFCCCSCCRWLWWCKGFFLSISEWCLAKPWRSAIGRLA